MEYYSAITDGRYKLEIVININENESLNIGRGTKVNVIGDLQELGKYF